MYQFRKDQNGVDDLSAGTQVLPGTPEWEIYLEWIAAGNFALPVDLSDEIRARDDGRQWFKDNPATLQLFTLTVAELETEIGNLVDALFPAATAQNRTRTKKFWMALALSVRFLVKKELA